MTDTATRVRPERRTRIDILVSVAIVAVLAVGATVVWYVSPARHTESEPSSPAPDVAVAGSVPERVTTAWRAASDATTIPAIAESVVITGDGGQVTGRDPVTGRERWLYRRDLPLCQTAAAWPTSNDETLAVYRNSRGCGEVTALDSSTGRRVGSRSSDADPAIRLVTDSGYVVSQGDTRLETWGSNLVRGIEYGRVDAPVKPGVQPGRTDCRLLSSAVGGDRVAVIERCAKDPGYRLTVLGAVLDNDEKVRQYGSSLITDRTTGPPPVLIGMNTSAIAVYDGGGNAIPTEAGATPTATPPDAPTIRQFDSDGAPTGSNAVNGPVAPPAGSVGITSGGLLTYWSGTATVVLSGQSMRPLYQVPGTLGPGTVMAGSLLLPSPSGISVRDPATGRDLRTIAVTRDGYRDGMIAVRTIGDTIVEQWGQTVTGLRPA